MSIAEILFILAVCIAAFFLFSGATQAVIIGGM